MNPDETARKRSEDLVAFLTPIVKAFLTDAAMEVTSLAVQIHGRHGFIRETGVEQLMRDARITPIYEGTNGIQALDLLGRKVFGTGGKSVQMMAARIKEAIDKFGALPEVAPFGVELGKRLEQWGRTHHGARRGCDEEPRGSGRRGGGLPGGVRVRLPRAGAGSRRRAWRPRRSPRVTPRRTSTGQSSSRRSTTLIASCRGQTRTQRAKRTVRSAKRG